MRRERADVAVGVAGAAFAGVCAVLVLLSIASLVRLGHPALGFLGANAWQSEAIANGQRLYPDPADLAYTPPLYTPGVALGVSVLQRIHMWPGWYPLVTLAGVLGLALVAARLAGLGRGITTSAAALGMGAVAVCLILPLEGDLLFYSAPDHVAWCLALGGLVAVGTARGRRGRLVAGAGLLTLGFWCKQTTLAADIAVALWLALEMRAGDTWTARSALAFLAGLAAANLAILGILNLLTGGWEFDYNFALSQKHVRIHSWADALGDYVPGLLLAAAVAVAAVAVAGRELRDSPRRPLAVLLAVFVVVGTPPAMVFARKQGGSDNQYLGVAWALALLAAAAFGAAAASRRRAGAQVLLAAVMLVVLAGTAAGATRLDLHALRIHYRGVDPAMLAQAERLDIFDPGNGDLGVERGVTVKPDLGSIMDQLAGGNAPRALIRDLAARRYDAVVSFAYVAKTGAQFAELNRYSSAYGRLEGGFLWKLDRLIASGYEDRGDGNGLLRRRARPVAAWVAGCFGPFRVAGARWTIGAGGGLWCPGAGNAIAFRGGPGRTTSLITSDAPPGPLTIESRARVTITTPSGGQTLPPGRGTVQLRGGRLTLSLPGRATARFRFG